MAETQNREAPINIRARLMQRLRAGAPYVTGGVRDQRDFARQWRRAPNPLEFGLLQFPVFHVEDARFGERRPAAERLGPLDGAHGVAGDVGHDGRHLDRRSERDHAPPAPDGPTRRGVHHGQCFVRVAGVVLPVGCYRVGHGPLHVVILDDGSDVLGANDVIGRERSPRGERGHVR